MTTNASVTLNISTTPQPGYNMQLASNAVIYYYQYTGGTDNMGDVAESGSGSGAAPATITVTLNTAGYTIDSVGFSGDTHNELSYTLNSPTNTIATITDSDQFTQDAYYSVIVNVGMGARLACDPTIKNT